MIWKLVLKAGGNSHISRRELFTKVGFQIDQNEYLQFLFIKFVQVDSYYSLAYASPRGNLRSWFKTIPAGEPLDSVVAKFRLKMRCEVQINWHLLTINGIIFVIGEFKIYISFTVYMYMYIKIP